MRRYGGVHRHYASTSNEGLTRRCHLYVRVGVLSLTYHNYYFNDLTTQNN